MPNIPLNVPVTPLMFSPFSVIGMVSLPSIVGYFSLKAFSRFSNSSAVNGSPLFTLSPTPSSFIKSIRIRKPNTGYCSSPYQLAK
ncbi:hypothetical protein D3C74_252440 [compost metagenome]